MKPRTREILVEYFMVGGVYGMLWGVIVRLALGGFWSGVRAIDWLP